MRGWTSLIHAIPTATDTTLHAVGVRTMALPAQNQLWHCPTPSLALLATSQALHWELIRSQRIGLPCKAMLPVLCPRTHRLAVHDHVEPVCTVLVIGLLSRLGVCSPLAVGPALFVNQAPAVSSQRARSSCQHTHDTRVECGVAWTCPWAQ
jgi:hypothetical protein